MEGIDIIIILCHLLVIFSFIFAGTILLLKLKGKQPEIRNYLLGIALFFILYGISHIFMFLFELTFDPFVWRIRVDDFDGYFTTNPDLLASYDLIWRLKNALSISGVIFLLYQLEKRILEKKTKYLITLIQIITVLPALLFGVSGKDVITWVKILLYFGNAWAISIFFIYLYYAGKTTGETRKRAIGAAIGMLFIFGAIVANSSFGKTYYDSVYGLGGLFFTYYLFAILAGSGILIYMKSIKYR